ncbi:chemotaxis protein CheA [Enterovibrio sp. Hal110]
MKRRKPRQNLRLNPPAVPVSPKPKTPAKAAAKTDAVSSIRVEIDKVDNLINLVGELVITQSMLTELGQNFSESKLERLQAGLDQLLQNTKELQESVLNIRMLPISFAFNRFPRLIRDLSSQLGKTVELVIEGEQTELDKTVLERITDPLVHLVRNAVDHGLEGPEARLSNGKSETGRVSLNAYHQGGSIVIEVRDDGAGLNKERVWKKAIEKGLLHHDMALDDLSDHQVYNLIFAPGFSTAEQVSDVSGRGVGMDVVKRNIEDLGGHIEVDSEPNVGSIFRISLPLTLAILDGQLIKLADQVFVVPLISIIESIQIESDRVKVATGGVELYRLREENIPILRLKEEFELGETGALDKQLLCLVEAGGNRVGLLLDEMLGQQQVVIKSLESNYTRVNGISGATILGDGSVSLILDVQGLMSGFLSRVGDSKSHIAAA